MLLVRGRDSGERMVEEPPLPVDGPAQGIGAGGVSEGIHDGHGKFGVEAELIERAGRI